MTPIAQSHDPLAARPAVVFRRMGTPRPTRTPTIADNDNQVMRTTSLLQRRRERRARRMAH